MRFLGYKYDQSKKHPVWSIVMFSVAAHPDRVLARYGAGVVDLTRPSHTVALVVAGALGKSELKKKRHFGLLGNILDQNLRYFVAISNLLQIIVKK